jgi:hypothetical protein
MSRARWLITLLPRRLGSHHGVENREELANARGEQTFFGWPAAIKRA